MIFDNWAWNVPRSCCVDARQEEIADAADVDRLVDLLPEHARAELRVERRQRRLGAEARVGLHPGGIVDGLRNVRRPGERVRGGQRHAERPDHLAVGQGVLDRLFEREIPDLRGLRIASVNGGSEPVTSSNGLTSDVGDLKVRGHPLVVG